MTLPLALPARDPRETAGQWLYRTLRSAILEGRLRVGARLPSTRELALQYGLSRGTIVSTFDQLRSEGYVDATMGSGTFVARVLPDRLLTAARPRVSRAVAAPRRRLSRFAQRLPSLDNATERRVRAFRTNEPALDLFPMSVWAQVAGRRTRGATTQDLAGCGPLGYPLLQQAVADYLTGSRGVSCEAGQVVIVSGTQEALDLIARILVDPGDGVAIENPGYIGATQVFEAMGATIVPMPLDEEGATLRGAALEAVRLAYLTPAHQFPLGMGMSLGRRLALLEWARATGAMLIEDDYDSEYRYSGRPTPALQGLDRHGVVLFSGSFSKVLFPSLRIGYLVVPPDLVDAFAAARAMLVRHGPLLPQAILADFITEGHFARHVRRMRQVYAERLSVLLESARARLGGLLDISEVEAGLQTAGWLGDGIDAEKAARAALERGVEVTPVGRYSRRPFGRQGLQLGFAAVDDQEIRRGVRDLAGALEAVRKAR